MASELLVGEQLSEDMRLAGAELLKALDKLQVLTKAAFWLLSPNERAWRYMLVSPEARTIGPRAVYRKVAAASRRVPRIDRQIPMSAVSVLDDRATVYALLRTAISTGTAGIEGIRFTQNVINGHRIEDAFIYRMT